MENLLPWYKLHLPCKFLSCTASNLVWMEPNQIHLFQGLSIDQAWQDIELFWGFFFSVCINISPLSRMDFFFYPMHR